MKLRLTHERWPFRRARLLRMTMDEHVDIHDRAAIAEALRRCDAAEIGGGDLLSLARVVVGATLLDWWEAICAHRRQSPVRPEDGEHKRGTPPRPYAEGCDCEHGCWVCDPRVDSLPWEDA